MSAYTYAKANPLACADAFVSLMLVLLASLPTWAGGSTNLPASDFASFAATSAFACLNTCGEESSSDAPPYG